MIYDYRCVCGEKFQKDMPIKFRNKVRCPKCRSKKVKRIIHSPSVIFVGNGWGKDKK